MRAVVSGVDIQRHPKYNKGLAFSEQERENLYLQGLLPPAVLSQELQVRPPACPVGVHHLSVCHPHQSGLAESSLSPAHMLESRTTWVASCKSMLLNLSIRAFASPPSPFLAKCAWSSSFLDLEARPGSETWNTARVQRSRMHAWVEFAMVIRQGSVASSPGQVRCRGHLHRRWSES